LVLLQEYITMHGPLNVKFEGSISVKNEVKGIFCFILFFGPCIFNNDDKNKPTKCTN